MKDHEKVEIARMRWRADILEYGAAGHESFGDQVNADLKRQQAAALRTFAAEMETYCTELDAAMAANDRLMVKQLMRRWQQFLSAWRDLGERQRTRPTTVDNFSEPSDEELLAGGVS